MIREVVRIDMSLTDEHIYSILKEQLSTGEGRISYSKIAELAKCHIDTAFKAARRLEAAGRIEIKGGRGGRKVFYKVIHEQTHMG